jgi:hypothetical protein
MAAAIYARISSDPDGTKPGGGRQLEDCRKLAAERGRPMADDYVDNDGGVGGGGGAGRPDCSIGCQARAEKPPPSLSRAPGLTGATVRFLTAGPRLGPSDFVN